MQEKILILDFGSQYTQLIARRVREQNVYCEIHPFHKIPPIDSSVKGIILSGSPFSVRDSDAPQIDLSELKGMLPILGVCYGAQYLSYRFGGEVKPSASREYGRAAMNVLDKDNQLLSGLSDKSQVWMSHGDTITSIPSHYRIIANTDNIPVAAFHPEVYQSVEGSRILSNFVKNICGCKGDWTPASFIESTVASLREQLGDDRVILGLSGGVDSSVAAQLLNLAIGDRLTCIFVDTGLLRKNEYEDVVGLYKQMGLNVVAVKAGDKFLSDLKGVTDPEAKRKIIGRPLVGAGNHLSRCRGVGVGGRSSSYHQVAP